MNNVTIVAIGVAAASTGSTGCAATTTIIATAATAHGAIAALPITINAIAAVTCGSALAKIGACT